MLNSIHTGCSRKTKSSKLKRSCKKALKIAGFIDQSMMAHVTDSGRLKQIQQLSLGAVKIHLDKYPFEELLRLTVMFQTGTREEALPYYIKNTKIYEASLI